MTAAQDELELRNEAAGIKTGTFISRLWRYLLALFCLVSNAQATPESICPGGASPRADIDWCVGFDDLDQCTTGQEAGCVSDAGLSSLTVGHADDFKIKTCPITSPITTSTGCIYGSGQGGSTGPGYTNKTYTGVTSACLRYYVRFGDGYFQNVSSTGNHGPGLIYSDGSSCAGKITIDFTLTEIRAIHQADATASCTATAPAGQNIATTGTEWTPKNGQWYRVEMCSAMNTTASSDTAGNGTFTLKVDGTTVISRTDLNIRGGTGETATYSDAYLARSYLGLGAAWHEPNIYFGGFAFSDDGTEIGASADQAADLGTGDTSSPYWYTVAGNGTEQQKLASDCSAPGSVSKYVTLGWDDPYSISPTYVTSPDHNDYACTAACGGCVTTNSMKAETTTTSQRAGLQHYVSNLNSSVNNTIVVHGWVYWPSGNSYTTTIPVMGISRYCAGGGGGNDRCVLGVGRNNSGNLALLMYTDNVAGTTITTSSPLATNTWHEIQVAVTDANKVHVQLNDSWVIDDATPSQAISTWAFDDVSAGSQLVVYGVMRDSPATTYTMYYDDMDAGGASFNDSRFWGSSDPFDAEEEAGAAGPGLVDCLLNFLCERRRRR